MTAANGEDDEFRRHPFGSTRESSLSCLGEERVAVNLSCRSITSSTFKHVMMRQWFFDAAASGIDGRERSSDHITTTIHSIHVGGAGR
mmetsp:Transcript_28380/g.59300  ORF Transcript_28380/g.59300 Transcript_28380/m.59300 type:complete len:88 (-) Transcript_28380:931-1194(-)